MALAANEIWDKGYLRDRNTGALMITRILTGATWQSGYLRDPDGRLVVQNG